MEDTLYKKIFENIASKAMFAILGLLGTIITIYAFFQEKKVDLRYEIIASTNVLDFNADVSKLEVTYDSTNLKQTEENLRVITIKVVNAGDKDILKEYFDENDPNGIKITSGQIIEKPEIIQASSSYLRRNLKITDYKNNSVLFSQTILESGEYFVLKLLVLHPKKLPPSIQALGKIAGQKEIIVAKSGETKSNQSFLSTTFGGNFWVHLLRLVSYFIVAVLILIVLVAVADRIEKYDTKKHRKKILRKFKDLKGYQYTRMDDAIFDRYQQTGAHNLGRIEFLLNDEKKLNRIYSVLSEGMKSKDLNSNTKLLKEYKKYKSSDNWYLIKDMLNDGLLFKDNQNLSVNLPMKDTFDRFIAFLREQGEFKNTVPQTIIRPPSPELENINYN